MLSDLTGTEGRVLKLASQWYISVSSTSSTKHPGTNVHGVSNDMAMEFYFPGPRPVQSLSSTETPEWSTSSCETGPKTPKSFSVSERTVMMTRPSRETERGRQDEAGGLNVVIRK